MHSRFFLAVYGRRRHKAWYLAEVSSAAGCLGSMQVFWVNLQIFSLFYDQCNNKNLFWSKNQHISNSDSAAYWKADTDVDTEGTCMEVVPQLALGDAESSWWGNHAKVLVHQPVVLCFRLHRKDSVSCVLSKGLQGPAVRRAWLL